MREGTRHIIRGSRIVGSESRSAGKQNVQGHGYVRSRADDAIRLRAMSHKARRQWYKGKSLLKGKP